MNVQLIALTAPVQEGLKTAEDLIVYAARVSNPSNQLKTKTGARLIKYCIQHGHWSVFETASMTLEITTSRAISAQLIRHRSFTFQEFSQRYAFASSILEVELRRQAKNNRQSSSEIVDDQHLFALVDQVIYQAQIAYSELLDAGVARECARMVLPMATQTTLYMTGSVRSWIHYFQQRCTEHAQKEHRLIAEAAREIFNQQFPTIAEALK